MGSVVSQLVRLALEPAEAAGRRNGVPLFKPVANASKPSLEMVNRLRDDS